MALVPSHDSQVVPPVAPSRGMQTPGERMMVAPVVPLPGPAPRLAPGPTSAPAATSRLEPVHSARLEIGSRKPGRRRYANVDPDQPTGPGPSMGPAVGLCAVSTVLAGVVAYGTHPAWAQYRHGFNFILLSRQVQWPFIVLSLIAAIALVAMVIAGRRRAWWLIGLAPVLALFGHRFATDPMAGITAVEDPMFVAADQAGSFLDNEDYVVGLTFEGKHYAYPYAALYSTPAVIHAQHDKRVLLMWSAPANRAVAYTVSRDVRARNLDVVSTPANALLIYDAARGVFINGLTAKTVAGEKPKGFGNALPTAKTQWWRWRAARPDTQVMAPAGPLAPRAPRQPIPPAYPMPPFDAKHALDAKVVLVGADRPAAVLADSLSAAPLNLSADGVPVLAFRDPETGTARGFRRRVDDMSPRFRANRDTSRNGVLFIDSDTSSGWSAAGVVVEGKKEFRGKKLAAVPVEDELYWGVMKFWYPQLQLNDGEFGTPRTVIEINGKPPAPAQPESDAAPGAAAKPNAGVTIRATRPPQKPANNKAP